MVRFGHSIQDAVCTYAHDLANPDKCGDGKEKFSALNVTDGLPVDTCEFSQAFLREIGF